MAPPPVSAIERRRHQPPGTAVDKKPDEVPPAVVAQCKASAATRGGSSAIQTLNQSLCEKLHASKNKLWVEKVNGRYYYTVQRRTEKTPFLRVPYDATIHPIIRSGVIAVPLGDAANKLVTPFANPSNAQELSYQVTMQENLPKAYPHNFLVVPSNRHEDVVNSAEKVHAFMQTTFFAMSSKRGTNFVVLDRCNLKARAIKGVPQQPIGCGSGQVAPFYTLSLWPKGLYIRRKIAKKPADAGTPQPGKPTPPKVPDRKKFTSIPEKKDGYFIPEKPDAKELARKVIDLVERQGSIRRKSVHMVWAIDNSTSSLKVRKILRRALILAARTLRKRGARSIQLGVVFFCDAKHMKVLTLKSVRGSKALRMAKRVSKVKFPKKCTEVEPVGLAIKYGILLLEGNRGDINTVSVFTDRDGIGDDHAHRYRFAHGVNEAVSKRIGVLLTQLDDPAKYSTPFVGGSKKSRKRAARLRSRRGRSRRGRSRRGRKRTTSVQPAHTQPINEHAIMRALKKTGRKNPNAWAHIIPLAESLAAAGKSVEAVKYVRLLMLRSDMMLTKCTKSCLGRTAAERAAKALSTMGETGLDALRTIVFVTHQEAMKQLAVETIASMGPDGQAMLTRLHQEVASTTIKAYIAKLLRNIPK